MSKQFDPSSYYSRGTSTARFRHQHTIRPETPQHIAVTNFGSYFVGPTEFAFADLDFTTIDTDMDGYQLRATDVESGISTVVSVPPTGPFQITGLALGHKYAFNARSVKRGINGDWGDPAGERMVPDSIPPDPPVISASAFNPGVGIFLTVPSSATDLKDYALYRSISPLNPSLQTDARIFFFTGGEVGYDNADYDIDNYDAPDALDDHILIATDYYYWVRSRDESGNLSIPSNVVGPISSGLIFGGDTTPPSIPNFAAASATPLADGRVKLEWPANPSIENVYGYTVLRFPAPASASLVQIGSISTTPGVTGTITFYDDTCFLGTQYGYTVSAFDQSGNESGYSTAFKYATPVDTISPAAPASGTIFGTLGRALFEFARAPERDVQFYEVQYAFDGASDTPAWSAITEVISTRFTLYGLTASRDELANNLAFRVRTVDGANNRSSFLTVIALYQDLLSYRPADNTIPASPYPVSASANDDASIDLSWEAIEIPDIDGYMVRRLDNLDPDWTVVGDFVNRSTGTIRATMDGLEPYAFRGTQYRFEVRTRDTSGNLSTLNLLENPSFESGSAGWTGSGLVSATAAFREGTLSIKAAGNAGLSQLVPAIPDQIYSSSIYVARAVSGSHTIVLRSRFLNAASGVLDNKTSTLVISDDNFHRVSLEGITAPSGTAYITIQPESTDADQFYWDDAQVENWSIATPWGDGKTGWVRARDLAPPSQTSGQLGLSASGELGSISLYWNNGTGFDFIQSTYEVWRGPSATSALATRIAEVVGQSGGRNTYTDFDPDTNIPTTSYFWLKARDRWGNLSSFINSAGVSATSKVPGDLNIATLLDNLKTALIADASTVQWADTLILDVYEDSSMVGSITGGIVDKNVGWYLNGLSPNTQYTLTSINFPNNTPTDGVSATSGVYYSMFRAGYALEAGASISFEISYNGGSTFAVVSGSANNEMLVRSLFPTMSPWTAGVQFKVKITTNSSGKGGALRYFWLLVGNSDTFNYWPGPIPIP